MLAEGGSGRKRWKVRPHRSNWGDFGDDDQVGRLNLITSECRLKAIEEVREGIVFCLSLPLDLPGGSILNPNREPPRRGVVEREPGWFNVNYPLDRIRKGQVDCVCDDFVTLFTQYSTQWDALSHVGQKFDADEDGVPETVYYNGFRAHEDILDTSDPKGPKAVALGIERAAETGIQGRGVMFNALAHFGSGRRAINYDDVMSMVEADGIELCPGDLVCFHTGMGQYLVDCKGNPDPALLKEGFAFLDGHDSRLLDWIDRTGLAAIVSDNYAVEDVDSLPTCQEDSFVGMPIHELCLFKLGVHLGELWWLTPLADWLRTHERTSFLLTAPPLRLPGAFGSPVTPVATV